MSQDNRQEVTFHAIVLGIILSVVMGAANVYLGLKVGMTVSASIPAAVIATGILRGLFRRRGLLEANMVQTAASAGESIAAGVVFTVPALLLTGVWSSFNANYLTIVLISVGGGMLGILFMIPMRRVFIVDSPELPYPEGKACAEVLRAGAAEGNVKTAKAGLRLVVTGLVIGAVFEILAAFLGVLAKSLTLARVVSGRVFYASCGVSPAIVGVGVIVGLPIAIQVFMGGAIGWLVALPILEVDQPTLAAAYSELEEADQKRIMAQFAELHEAERTAKAHARALEEFPQAMASETAGTLWSGNVRYLGVGAMVIGGLISLWQVRRGLVAAITELIGQFRKDHSTGEQDEAQRNLPGKAILGLLVFTVLVIALLYYTLLAKDIPITLLTTTMMIIMAFFFTAVASYIVGLVGNSNSPVSGMTIMALLSTGILIYLLNYSGGQAILATLGVAGVVCCAACTSGDVCNDLKTGHLVGASPRSQQIMQVMAVVVACLVMAPILQILHSGSIADGNGGFGKDKSLSAPQAKLMSALVETLFPREESEDSAGDGAAAVEDSFVFEGAMLAPSRWGEIPAKPRMMGLGAILGIVLLLIGLAIRASGSSFRLHVMPIAVGIYLPFGTVVALLIGGVVGVFIRRLNRPGHDATAQSVLAASGLIAGEALAGILVAMFKILGFKIELGVSSLILNSLSILVMLGVCFWLYNASKSRGLTDAPA